MNVNSYGLRAFRLSLSCQQQALGCSEFLRGRKRGMFEEPDMLAKRQCVRAAFQMFDRDLSGTIDLQAHLGARNGGSPWLSKESGTPQSMFTRPFNPNTMLWLAGKYARQGGGYIHLQEFCATQRHWLYLESVKNIFTQIDTDRTGDISVSELSRALKLSGFNVWAWVQSQCLEMPRPGWSGHINLAELNEAFAMSGMPLPHLGRD
eukprot:Skav225262  [mRNA]  locus=scaffold4099:63852:67514:+ [translate_table: standard]